MTQCIKNKDCTCSNCELIRQVYDKLAMSYNKTNHCDACENLSQEYPGYSCFPCLNCRSKNNKNVLLTRYQVKKRYHFNKYDFIYVKRFKFGFNNDIWHVDDVERYIIKHAKCNDWKYNKKQKEIYDKAKKSIELKELFKQKNINIIREFLYIITKVFDGDIIEKVSDYRYYYKKLIYEFYSDNLKPEDIAMNLYLGLCSKFN